MLIVDQNDAGQLAPEELLAENLRLRQLVGELLLKNQRLRERSPSDQLVSEFSQSCA